ncbi:hypothetical protein PBT90_03420 [Algoriphagus halophytocola]|uniref:Uncharacterized protein n=1 Tax=Algoriphagus halophytocola TaxID=2991499 RepID=A0ABY6MJ82_9BACT|nr:MULTISPECIES: hypothetical protein [unclassified Algoriphagus]UZD22477.1 hypothetical protein OM944_17700 [Algoriphagus sp. TR-M5]WBL43737.1 hypothetical protein PBT90_03420 [Algoriphagus sp. TR-M9]
MKLSPSQISQIQSSLSSGNIYYDDIRAELVDHIATEIEENLDEGQSFDLLLHEKLSSFNQKKFQRILLLQTHLGMLKAIFKKMLSFWLAFKVIVMTYFIGFIVTAFSNYTPEFAEQVLKTSFILIFLAVAILGLIRTRLLKNSQIIAAGNMLFMLAMLSQFVLQLEWLQWTGLTNQTLLYAFTFWFCLLLVSGFRVLSGTVKRAQLA